MHHSRTAGLFALGVAAFLSFAADAGKEVPIDLTLTDMNGRKVHLRDFPGKAIVLNLWATWCLPCREEMPMMVEAEKVWGPKGIVFIAASLDDSNTKHNIPAFLKRYQITFPVWTGATADDMEKLHLGDAVPDTVFLDRDHVIFARARGEIRRTELEERLEWVTGDRSHPAPQPLLVHSDK